MDNFNDAFIKNFTTIALGVIINYINGTFVYIFFKSHIFYSDPRYILYIHLVINDMIMLSFAVMLQVITYALPYGLNMFVCCMMLVITSTTNRNSPLNLAGMAIERYIAVCKPLLSDIIIVLATKPFTIFSTGVLCYNYAVYGSPYHDATSTAVHIVNLSFVFLTLFVTYFKVHFAAKAAITDPASARKARNTILLHGVQLLFCMLGYITPLTNMILLSLFPNKRTTILFSNFLFTNVLPRLLSPVIYGLRDQKFAKYMRAAESFISQWAVGYILPQIDDHKFGWIKGHSTTHCLLDLTNELYKHSNKPGFICSLVTTEFSKAF
ncbi:odorant receptor 131-2-like [Oncorhynchus masou masou]|uniref:odorant receptor 131-2-like n=1 Tax=Oncorhynchus masou masou TaxID=90313 RepID=UPI0031834BBD